MISSKGLVLDMSIQKLQETGRNIIIDKSRHMNHGMCMNETNIIQTKEGIGALSFNGVNDYVDCGNDASLKPTKVVTMEFWVNLSSYSNVVANHQFGFPRYGGYTFWQMAENGVPQLWVIELNMIGGTSRSMSLPIDTIPLNINTHIVIIFDGEHGKLTFYKNGAFFQEGSILTGDIVYSGNFFIGDKLNGFVDEVRVYNRALSLEEIRGNMFASKRYHFMRGWKS